jgi:peptidyl-dipeptidase A
MKTKLMAACAAVAFLSAGQAMAQAQPTPAEAKAFVEDAEKQLAAAAEYANHASWVRANFITTDTEWLEAKANAEGSALTTKLALEAAKFNGVAVDPVTARKLKLIKLVLPSPPPARPGAAEELSKILTRMDSAYSTGKFAFKGKQITLNDAEDIMRESRDPADLKAAWEGWHSIAPPIKADYAKFVELSNEGARGLGFKDSGALWRSNYDMEPDAFAAETDRLWKQVEPFYRNLHCYVRARLNEKYGDAVQPRTGPIRADLLGNMWAQEWGNIYDVVAPKTAKSSYDLNQLLVSHDYDAVKMAKTGEAFYSSLGFAPLPKTFWERSLLTRPRDREVVCHASAWDLDGKDDIRVKACLKPTADDFVTIHHELGHNYYQRAYNKQPFIYLNGANDGFHEAIGDFVALSITPEYLTQIGLLDRSKVPSADKDTGLLLRQAMDKVAFLPFGLMVDKWRWGVFDGSTPPANYNASWVALKQQYQGITPPVARSEADFDPGAKFHIPGNTPYARYFLARLLQFQFYKAACDMSGWKGPLHRCSFYGNKQVGARLNAMLAMGASKPWPDALEAFTGSRDISGKPMLEYFAPLSAWLEKQNAGKKCGW